MKTFDVPREPTDTANRWMPSSLASHAAVTIFAGQAPHSSVDPFTHDAVEHARGGARLLVLTTAHAGRNLLHAAAGLPASKTSLNKDEFVSLANAGAELESLRIEFLSCPEMIALMKRWLRPAQNGSVLMMDLRDDPPGCTLSLERTLLLQTLDKFLQRPANEYPTVMVAVNPALHWR
jgi:hypothetical protein